MNCKEILICGVKEEVVWIIECLRKFVFNEFKDVVIFFIFIMFGVVYLVLLGINFC